LHHGHERCLNQHDEQRLLASVRAVQDHAVSRRFDSRITLVSLDSQPHCDFRGAHLKRLADDERERFLDAGMVRLGERPLRDYVRLNIVARRR
jgi:hypothetical protein